MKIRVEYDGHKWFISPDPAIVSIGTPIEWEFVTRGAPFPQMRWTVYFKLSPFGIAGSRFSVTTFRTGPPSAPHGVINHQGTVGPVAPVQAGDYKYGVKVEDPTTNQPLGDDDPRLIVQP